MDAITAQRRFEELRQPSGPASDAELDEIWAALETLRAEDMLGAWKGSEFDTGHPLNGLTEREGWHGKTFVSLTDVKPLVCRDENGNLYSNVELGHGEASLWNAEFRGEVTATMVYDGQPVLDHFKRVNDTTLMGIMNGKGLPDDRHVYFILDRES